MAFTTDSIKRNLELMNEEISEEERNEVRKKYATEKEVLMSRRQLIAGKAHRLVWKVIENGGTKEEVHLALQHLAMCLDSVEYKLDWKKYKEDNDIQGLINKYKKYDKHLGLGAEF